MTGLALSDSVFFLLRLFAVGVWFRHIHIAPLTGQEWGAPKEKKSD